MLDRIGGALAALHGTADVLTGELIYFSPFQTVRTYVATARRLGAALPDGIDEHLTHNRQLESSVGPFRPTLCHNDLLPANLLAADDRLWIVDWEYAGIGNPLFDLASVVANARLDTAQRDRLLTAYFSRSRAGNSPATRSARHGFAIARGTLGGHSGGILRTRLRLRRLRCGTFRRL